MPKYALTGYDGIADNIKKSAQDIMKNLLLIKTI